MEWSLDRKAELGDFPPEGLEQVKCWAKKAVEEVGRNGKEHGRKASFQSRRGQ